MTSSLVRFNHYSAPYWRAIDEAERDRIVAAIPAGHHLSIAYGTRPGDWSVRLIPDVSVYGGPVAHVQHARDLATACRRVLAEGRLR